MISVVVPVFNTGNYLPKAIDSLMNQTYGDYEIIIVDDGSNDGSSVICDNQAERSKRIRVYHKPNGGVSSARNFGMEKAKGEWVVFPDPDDWVEPDYLEHLESIRVNNQVELSICGHFVHSGSKTITWNEQGESMLLDRDSALKAVMMPNLFCGFAWNKLYSLQVIRANNLKFDTDLGMAQDLHFAVMYLKLCHLVAYNPTPLYHYYRDNGGVSTTGTTLSQHKINGLKTYEKIAEMTKDDFPEVEAIAYYSLVNTCLRFIHDYFWTKMNSPEILNQLCSRVKKYRKWYTTKEVYPSKFRHFVWLAPLSPRLYFNTVRIRGFLSRIFRKKEGTENNRTS